LCSLDKGASTNDSGARIADGSGGPSGPATQDAAQVQDSGADVGPKDSGPDVFDAGIVNVAFVAEAKLDAQANVTNVAVPTPAGVIQNDAIVVGLFTDVATTVVTTPTNWTRIGELAGDGDNHGWWYIRIVGAAAEPATTTFNFNTSTPLAASVAVAYRNVDTAAPVNASAFAKSDGTTTYTATSVTPNFAPTRLVGIFIGDGTTAAAWTAPANLTRARETAGTIGFFDQQLLVTGATGTRAATSTVASQGISALIALKPKN
jgi:hypothetical protein